MNKVRKTLGQLFSAQEETDKKNVSEETDKEAKDKTDDDQESGDDDDEKDKDKKKKPFGSSKDDEKDKKKDADADPVAGDAGTVVLALEDYDKLISLASEAKAANAKLKAKADQWDAYQAAVSGNKPGADTAGAKAEQQQEGSKDPHADLRSKYGSLMKDC